MMDAIFLSSPSSPSRGSPSACRDPRARRCDCLVCPLALFFSFSVYSFCACGFFFAPWAAPTMPGAHSKESAAARKKAQLRLLNLHMMSNIALSLFTFSSRTTLLQELVKNDSARMVNILSAWASTIGAAEFLLNPTMGRLSDYYGRKPFMLMSPVACVVLKTWCALNPSVLALSLEKVICDGLRT